MTDLSIRVMPNLESVESKFVLTQSKSSTARRTEVLSVDDTDFRLYELLKNDSRSHDRTGQHT
jgi:hypothetical protein